jgi:lysozyme
VTQQILPTREGYHLGIDASRHQGTIPWGAMAEQVKFAYLKSTEGISYQDPKFAESAKACPRDRVFLGAYHYFLPERDPIAQAKNFHDVAGASTNLLPALDFEIIRGETKPLEAIRSAVRFVEKTEQLWGCRCLVYSYPNFLDQFRAMPKASKYLQALGQRPLWVAHYRPRNGIPRVPWPWQQYAIWQFDGDGGLALPNGVDCDFNWAPSLTALRRT